MGDVQERNKAIAARYWEALYSHDWEAVAGFFSPTANYVDKGLGESLGGAHGPDEIVARLRLGLDPVEAHNHVEGMMIAEGDIVVTEHEEEWVFHTGERILHPFASVMVFAPDGKIERWWDYSNLGNLLDNAPTWWLEHIAQGYRSAEK
tara:strand:- start:650 stop:1096 length:447 start_codon:yes stop_codon:yes gene_type:complete